MNNRVGTFHNACSNTTSFVYSRLYSTAITTTRSFFTSNNIFSKDLRTLTHSRERTERQTRAHTFSLKALASKPKNNITTVHERETLTTF